MEKVIWTYCVKNEEILNRSKEESNILHEIGGRDLTWLNNNNNNNNNIYLFTAIGLLPAGSGYFTCKQNMKLVTAKFKSGGLHKNHVVATWNVGNRLGICL